MPGLTVSHLAPGSRSPECSPHRRSRQGVSMRARVPVTRGLVTILFACQDHAGTLGPDEASSARAPAAASFSTASRSAPITPCWVAADLPSQPGSGAMGFHWGNLDYILDGGKVDLLQPELLMYEPEKNGKLRFVGVEYIVLFSDHPSTAEPPTLLGQEFSRVPEAGVWGLHIWVGRENSAGIFMPWNEKVSCEFAAGASAAGHHHGE